MKNFAKTSFFYSFYFICNSAELIGKKVNDNSSNKQAISSNKSSSSTCIFEGRSLNFISPMDILNLSPSIERVIFKNTMLYNIPDMLFLQIPNVKTIEIIDNVNLSILPRSFYDLKAVKTLTVVNSQCLKPLPTNFNCLENFKYQNNDYGILKSYLTCLIPLIKLSTLDLSNNNLQELPSTLCDLKQIQILNMSSNEIEKINEKIINMENLKELNLSNNKIRSIKNVCIEVLKNIETINLSQNRLGTDNESSPGCFNVLFSNKSLQNPHLKQENNYKLKHLDISSNKYPLPDRIFDNYIHILENLETLRLYGSKMNTFPEFIYDLKKLKLLDIKRTSLTLDNTRIEAMNLESLLK